MPSKDKHILQGNKVPALDNFLENSSDRMCPMTEHAPFSPIHLALTLNASQRIMQDATPSNDLATADY